MAELKLDKNDVRIIKKLIEGELLTDTEIANQFGVSRKHINSIRNKKRWNYPWV